MTDTSAYPTLPEPAAHMLSHDLEKFKATKFRAMAYSVPFSTYAYGRSEPLFTAQQMREYRGAPAWLPIETGPVATKVLALWRPVDHETRPFHKEIVIGSRCYDFATYKPNGRFYSGGLYYDEATHVTHYMPLPAAPSEQSGEKL